MSLQTLYDRISANDETIFNEPGKKNLLLQAINELPGEQQNIISMHFDKAIPVKEIAKKLKKSTTFVYVQLNTALYNLTKQFNPEFFRTGKKAGIEKVNR